MIWQLVKRDPAWRIAPYFVVAGVVFSPFVPLAAILGLTCLVLPQFRQRWTPFQAALPIDGRQLIASRVLSLLAFIWMPILAAMARMLAGRGEPARVGSLPLLEAGVIVTTVILLVQSVRIRELSPPPWLTIVAYAGIFLLLPIMGSNLFPGPVAVVIAVVAGCTVASAVLFLKAWMSVPKAFQLAPAEAASLSTEPSTELSTERAGRGWPAFAWWPVFHALYGRWQVRLFPSVSLVAALAGNWGFALLMAPSFYGSWHWLLHLPVSARKLFWALWLPLFAPLLAGLLLNPQIDNYFRSKRPAVFAGYSRFWDERGDARGSAGTPNVQVPAAYWRWARGSTAPAVEAPWGERVQPATSIKLGLAFYNPYSVDRSNSRRFLEWQFMRATEAVYGRPIALLQSDEIQKRGMKMIIQQPKARIIASAVILIFALIQICLLQLRNPFAFAPAILFLLYPMAVMPFFFQDTPNYLHNPLFDALVLYLARVPPHNPWLLTLLTALPLVGLYWLAEKLFRERESVTFAPR
jgi:hypothetical protein